ncbi:metallo-beta-lactamase superfamily protein [Coniochaeta sp. PMI_546]|nr:metallo-beta-lactamase superfamily protein [Coniochaeta sp. PMI_546]
MAIQPIIHDIFEPRTSTWQYIVADPVTKAAVIIDSVLDYDSATNTVFTENAEVLLSLVKENDYKVEKLLETHVHADHLTASRFLQVQLQKSQGSPPEICIGQRISQVQERFAKRYGIAKQEYVNAFDHTFNDDEAFQIGQIEAKAVHLPGHTPDHLGYMIGSNVFCGDSLFNVDVGSARCDFPGGNASDLYNSARKLLSLPDDYRIWTGHDYPPGGDVRKDPLPYYTVADQRKANKHLKDGVQEHEFVQWRKDRDVTLAEPKLIHQALQVNIRAGRLPVLSASGDRLMHIPLKVRGEGW